MNILTLEDIEFYLDNYIKGLTAEGLSHDNLLICTSAINFHTLKKSKNFKNTKYSGIDVELIPCAKYLNIILKKYKTLEILMCKMNK